MAYQSALQQQSTNTLVNNNFTQQQQVNTGNGSAINNERVRQEPNPRPQVSCRR